MLIISMLLNVGVPACSRKIDSRVYATGAIRVQVSQKQLRLCLRLFVVRAVKAPAAVCHGLLRK